MRRSAFPLLLALLPLTGCTPQQERSAQPEPEYSIVIEDVSPPSRSETTVTDQTESVPQTVTEAETTASETTAYLIDTETLTETEPIVTEARLEKDGSYTTKEDVSLYLYTYGELPQNFITKKEAQALGWSGGSLEPYAPGKCIGGSFFGNYEGNLPTKKGREYHECDIDTLGKSSRGAKRIVYSSDGLIYYTEDHYNTFELLYGEE